MFVKEVSIIIPTKNDYGYIVNLVKHIHEVMQLQQITYEILFIDDHSTDLTHHIINQLPSFYPIRLYVRKQKKVYAFLECVHFALYKTVISFCAKGYSPEIIPNMIKKIDDGMDVVVVQPNGKVKRNTIDTLLFPLWGKKFHHLNVDFNAEVKAFRKYIFDTYVPMHTSPEIFWFEFLIRSRNSGYRIGSFSYPGKWDFSRQKHITTPQIVWDISSCAINLKFSNPDVIPFDEKKTSEKGFRYKGKKFIHYSQLTLPESAFFRLSNGQKKTLVGGILLFIAALILYWQQTLIAFLGVLTFLYFSDLLFNFYLIMQSFIHPSEIFIEDIEVHADTHWPTYTIFCPLYKESEVLQQFIQAIEDLDYPKEKIQVILLLEEDDTETLNRIHTISLPSFFEIRIPPPSFPKTKPKALNFGLQYAKGEYCVVYDAEDIPDKTQLKKVVLAFRKAGEKVKCIQAKLNFYNPFQNILTRVFTAEYSLWFDLVLTGLQSTHSPIPLGGTSNHFKTKELRQIRGWDSFNVTEDCDLGLRLAKNGYETAIVNSTTLEEANSDIPNWFSQRGRWIKGYIQTYLVHARNPINFIKTATLKQFLAFQLVVGGKVMSLFINPLMWTITLLYFLLRPFVGHTIEKFFPGPILYLGVLCLVFGNFLYLYYYMVGCAKRGQYSLIKYAFLVPFYWLAMSISGWNALYKILTQPHYWAKTHHGFHLQQHVTWIDKLKYIINPPVSKPQVSI